MPTLPARLAATHQRPIASLPSSIPTMNEENMQIPNAPDDSKRKGQPKRGAVHKANGPVLTVPGFQQCPRRQEHVPWIDQRSGVTRITFLSKLVRKPLRRCNCLGVGVLHDPRPKKSLVPTRA